MSRKRVQTEIDELSCDECGEIVTLEGRAAPRGWASRRLQIYVDGDGGESNHDLCPECAIAAVDALALDATLAPVSGHFVELAVRLRGHLLDGDAAISL
jgi:hypothetical protein